jgi:hypothetical protein
LDEDIGLAGVRSGRRFALINDEIFSFEGIHQISTIQYQLDFCHRGLLDTVPRDHAVNSRVMIIGNDYPHFIPPTVSFHHATSPDKTWHFYGVIPPSKGGRPVMTVAASNIVWQPTINRGGSPLRPHDTNIDGVRSPVPQALSISMNYDISWKTRNRATVDVSLQTDAAETPEVSSTGDYQVHRVIIVDSADVEHDCGVTSDTGPANDLTILVPPMALGDGWLYVQAEITLNGETFISQFQDRLPVTIS